MNGRITAEDGGGGQYTKKPGDFEVRILKDGRVVFVAPDQEMLDVSESLKDTNAVSKTDEEQMSSDTYSGQI